MELRRTLAVAALLVPMAALVLLTMVKPDTTGHLTGQSTKPKAGGTASELRKENENGAIRNSELSDAGRPLGSYRGVGPDANGVLGNGRAIRLEDIPAGVGQLRAQIEKLPDDARRNALRNLEAFTLLKSDLASLHADYGGELYFGCKLDSACTGCSQHPAESGTPLAAHHGTGKGGTADGMNAEDAHALQFGPTAEAGGATLESEGMGFGPPLPGSSGTPFEPTDPVLVATPPAFHSLPGATNVLFLDFNGHVIENTRWNNERGVATFVCRPFDADGNEAEFSVAEQEIIFEIWKRVAEDYAPFNINVTTEEPAQWTSTTGHAMITPGIDANGVALPHNGYTGVAYVNVFGAANYSYNAASNIQSPAWVAPLSGSSYADTADVAAHELGHNFGLFHHGATVGGFLNEYYGGHNATPAAPSWAPLMGSPYGKSLTQWSRGDYYNANRPWQDDLATIAGKTGYRPDTHGNNAILATEMPLAGSGFSEQGIILAPDDLDVFAIPSGGGELSISVEPYRADAGTWGGNLDAELILYDESGSVVASSNPPTAASASVSVTVPAGNYFAYVSPVGAGSPMSTSPSGYSAHGSRGGYTVSGSTVVPPAPTQPVITAQPQDAVWEEGQSHAISVTASGSGLRYQWRKDGEPIPDAGFSTYTVAAASSADIGEYEVYIWNTAGNVTSATALVAFNAKPEVTVLSPSNPADIRIPSGAGLWLEVLATDDGVGGSTLTSAWSVVQSPTRASVTFDDTSAMSTGASFSTDGDYVLRYSAADGTHVTTRDFFVQVGTAAVALSDLGLVVHYPMEEASGTAVSNAAGSNYDATLVGSSSFQGSSILLDGGYIPIPSGPEIDTAGPYAKRSIAVRFKRTSNTRQVLYEEGLFVTGISAELSTSNEIILRFSSRPNNLTLMSDYTVASSALAPGQWNHMLIVLDATPGATALEAGALRLYLNGELLIEGDGMPMGAHADGIGLGGINQSMRTGSNSQFINQIGGLPFLGEIADFRLYNRALDAVEAEKLYRTVSINLAPVVSAGDAFTALANTPAALSGSVVDPDGPQAATLQWSKLSGPGTVDFSAPGSLDGTVTASLPGTYWLRLTANDGETTAFADVRMEVLSGSEASRIRFESASQTLDENSGYLELQVRRVGTSGAVSVAYQAEDLTAVNGTDYQLAVGSLSWADQEDGVKVIPLHTIDNFLVDGDRDFQVRLQAPTGGATLDSPDLAAVTILDDDAPIPPHHGIEIVFQNLAGRETLHNFPALVKLTPANTGNYAGFLDTTNGWDLRFWTEPGMQGTELAYEIESFDSSGESSVWVKVPEFAQGRSIWATWGNADYNFQAPYTGNGEVWDEDFAAVWHLGESAGVADLTDATANNNHADLNSGTQNATGLIGKGQSITTRGSYIRIPDSPSLSHTGSITLEAWGNLPSFPTGTQNIMAKDSNNAWRYRIQSSGGTFWSLANDGSGFVTQQVAHPFSPDTWYHLTCVMDFSAGEVRFYVNGTQVGSPQPLTAAGLSDTDGPLLLGGYLPGNTGEGFIGLLDEMRISNLVRSADWIWASAMNQGASHATLQSYGPIIIRPNLTPLNPPAQLVATAANGQQVDLSWSDQSDDETAFIIERSTSADSGFLLLATTGPNVTSYADTTVVANTSYYYRLRTINAANTSPYTTLAFVSTPVLQATVSFADLTQTYDGSHKSATVSTVPEGLAVLVAYDNAATPPILPGTYTVGAVIQQTGYTGSASGTFTIAKIVPTIASWPTAAGIVPGEPLSAATLSGGSASVPGSFAYDAPDTILEIGTHTVAITFTPTDNSFYDIVAGTVEVTVSDLSAPDVVGQSQASAESMITGAGLVVGVVTESYHPTVPAGEVLSQNPIAGTPVLADSAVDIVVSIGPEPDLSPPVVVAFSPAHEAQDVSLPATLSVTFDEDVAFGTGLIAIHKASDDSLLLSFDVANPPAQLTLDGSVITIDPGPALDVQSTYYLTIAPTAIQDLEGNFYAGISNDSTWRFTTGVSILLTDDFTGTTAVGLNQNLDTRQSGSLAPSGYTVENGSTSVTMLENRLRVLSTNRIVNNLDLKTHFTEPGVVGFSWSIQMRHFGTSGTISSYLSTHTDTGISDRETSRFGLDVLSSNNTTALTVFGHSGSARSTHDVSKAELINLLGASFATSAYNTYTFVATPSSSTAGTYDLLVNDIEVLSDIPYLIGDGGADAAVRWEIVNASGSSNSNADSLRISRTMQSPPRWTNNPVGSSIAGADGFVDLAYTGSLAEHVAADVADTLAFAKVSGPAWLGVANDGSLSGTPGSDDLGPNSFTVSVSNGIGATVEATLAITVEPTPLLDYTVSFDANGGSTPDPISKQVTNGSDYGPLANTIRAGYTFTGWFTAVSGGSQIMAATVVSETSNHTLYAQWSSTPEVDAGANQSVALGDSTPWTPANIATAAWYDASDATTITHNIGAVSEWRDKSLNGYHLTQGTSGAKPTTGTQTINTLNGIDFDGVDDLLKNAAFTAPDADFVVSFVVQPNEPIGNTSYEVFCEIPYSNDSFIEAQYKGSTGVMKWYAPPDEGALGGLSVSGAPTVYTLHSEGTTTSVYANGTLRESSTVTSITGLLGISLGSGFDGSASCKVRIGEVVIHDRGEDVAKVDGYLAWKWGLEANLPADHPYKAAAPSIPTAVATLDGTVTDPNGGTPTTIWSMRSGPAVVTFADAAAVDTTATFSTIGSYTLRLTADDGFGSSFDDVVITVGDVVAPAPFEEWSAGDSGVTFSGDANGDGLADGLAWLLGADSPDQTAAGLRPVAQSNNGDLVVTFRALQSSARGTAMLKLQYSQDLGLSDDWASHTIDIPETSGTDPSGVVFVITPVEGTDLNDVQATVPESAMGDGNKFFVRLLGEATSP